MMALYHASLFRRYLEVLCDQFDDPIIGEIAFGFFFDRDGECVCGYLAYGFAFGASGRTYLYIHDILKIRENLFDLCKELVLGTVVVDKYIS